MQSDHGIQLLQEDAQASVHVQGLRLCLQLHTKHATLSRAATASSAVIAARHVLDMLQLHAAC